MTTDEVLTRLRDIGVSLTVEDGELVVRVAGQVPSPELREALEAHKAEIVARLEDVEGQPGPAALRYLGPTEVATGMRVLVEVAGVGLVAGRVVGLCGTHLRPGIQIDLYEVELDTGVRVTRSHGMLLVAVGQGEER